MHPHLSNGTRQSRKAKNIRDVRRYLQVTSLSNSGLFVCRIYDPYVLQKDLIVVPNDILAGLITALHLHFNYASKHQLPQVFGRYFYGFNSKTMIQSIVNSCSHCNSLAKLFKEIFVQTSVPSPTTSGQQFAADVIRHNQQKIFII